MPTVVIASHFQPVLIAVLKLFGFTVAGYLVFSIRVLQRHALSPSVYVTLNIIFPIYLIGTFPAGWSDAVAGGWGWMVVFFASCLVMMGLQGVVGSLLVRRVRLFRSTQPRALIAMFVVHNAGFIPLPILSVFAPPALMVYMFFYVFAFNLVMWTVAFSYIAAVPENGSTAAGISSTAAGISSTAAGISSTAAGAPGASRRRAGHRTFRLRINPPLVGVAVGFVLTITGWYNLFPTFVKQPVGFVSRYALDLVLFMLGGILARIPRNDLRIRREFVWFVVVKMIVFPILMLGLMLIIQIPVRSPAIASSMVLAFVLEAAQPPGTSIMIVAQAHGTDEQVRYAGNGFIITYVASLITLPGLLFLATVLSR